MRLKRRKSRLGRALADLDQSVLSAMRTRGHGPLRDAVMKRSAWRASGRPSGSRSGSPAPRRPTRRGAAAGSPAAAIGPAAIGLNFAIKVAVGRKRPLLEEHPPLARAPTKLSFPSAHATSSLAAATALGRVRPPRAPGALRARRGGSASRAPTSGCTTPPTSSRAPRSAR